ncbi:MAG: hypothetical protein OXG69_03625 [bacterium]|nr:hypothetical protein [bacterium]
MSRAWAPASTIVSRLAAELHSDGDPGAVEALQHGIALRIDAEHASRGDFGLIFDSPTGPWA